MPPTLQYRRFGNLVLAVQAAAPPGEDEWAGYVNLWHGHWLDADEVRILVVSAGGAPSNRQRRQVDELTAGLEVRIAVVGLDPVVAAVVGTQQFANDQMRRFPPDGLERALDFLDVPQAERGQVAAAVAEMRRQAGI